MSDLPVYFWDSCCFIRGVTRIPLDYTGDLDQFIADARADRVKIFYSTIVYSEFRPRYFKGSKYGEISEFFADFRKAFQPIEPNPNIMMWSGRLRDAEPVNPSNPKIEDDLKRRVGAADSIHLATAVHLRDVHGYSGLIMHSFDRGGSKTAEGKCVPIVGFERWFPDGKRTPEVQAVCDLPRIEPKHPTPDLATKAGR
ncbi:MAG: hypothetical protein ABSC25_21960 [Roseiarcus sp.]